MKIGISTWVWASPLNTELVEELVPRIAEFGFDWVEMPIETPDEFDYARAAALVRGHHLGVSIVAAMSPDRDLLHVEEKVRENAAAYIRHCIDAAQILGATNFVGPFYSAVGRFWLSSPEQREQEVQLLVPQLRELADYAAERNVTLCVEAVNRFETSFINTASQAIELVDRVAHPAFQMVLDTFHMNIEEKSIGNAIRAAGPRLHHLHAGENDRGTLGEGHLPWSDVATALRDINYNGPVVIETFSDKIESIAAAAAIWRPLADNQDTLAKEGLVFLRQLLL